MKRYFILLNVDAKKSAAKAADFNVEAMIPYRPKLYMKRNPNSLRSLLRITST
jgi:hypothetical protein